MFLCDSLLPSFAPRGLPSRASRNQITAGLMGTIYSKVRKSREPKLTHFQTRTSRAVCPSRHEA
eukprot:1643282-Prymnesium_polylepis.1